MGQWLIMKTPGFLRDHLFYLRILTVCTVLSTGLLIKSQANNTSDANTSINSESLEVSLGKLSLRVTGKNTMDRVMNLMPIESLLEMNVSNEK